MAKTTEGASAPQPQMTFTEAEVAQTAAFVNFIYKKARWDVSTEENQQLTKYLVHMAQLIKKMDSHIMELKRVIQAPTDGEKK